MTPQQESVYNGMASTCKASWVCHSYLYVRDYSQSSITLKVYVVFFLKMFSVRGRRRDSLLREGPLYQKGTPVHDDIICHYLKGSKRYKENYYI